jgi:hypothetical protein
LALFVYAAPPGVSRRFGMGTLVIYSHRRFFHGGDFQVLEHKHALASL